MKTLMVLAMMSFTAAYAADDIVKSPEAKQEIKAVSIEKKVVASAKHKKHEVKKETKVN